MKGIFDDLADLKRWVPYRLTYNPEREKFDKIPHNSSRGLSSKNPNDWATFSDAYEMSEKYTLSGVGIILTDGIEEAGWTFIGLDYDKVDFKCFKLPFKTYAEKSPSGTGIHAYAWVPTPWVKRFKDCNAKVPHCEHVDLYFGSSPRFLTVSFDPINEYEIAFLQGEDLLLIEQFGLKPADELEVVKPLSLPAGEGTPIELKLQSLTHEQKLLVEGKGGIDRSATLHGLLIKLIDNGHPQQNIMATLLKVPALFAYLMSHRSDNPAKAIQFASDEIKRAFKESNRGKMEKLADFSPRWKPAPPKPVASLAFPRELYDEAPGLVGEVARWIYGASYVPRIEYAYACALSMLACLAGPYCGHGARHSKLNLYLVLVGNTGAGKNEAMDPMAALLNQTDAKDSLTDFPASEAGLRRHLNVNPNLLIRADEIAHKLDSMKNNANGSALGRILLEAYNGTRMGPKPYADERRNLEAVENPFVQILGGCTDKIWEVVKSSHMDDGTLNRFLFVCLPEELEYSFCPAPKGDAPKALVDKLNAFFRQGKMYDLIGYVPPGHGRVIKTPDNVQDALTKLHKEMVWPLTQQKPFGNLYNRFLQNMEKVMAILAISENRQEVTMRDFAQAKMFIQWCLDNTHHKVSTQMFETNFERYSKRLMAKITETGGMSVRNAYKFMKISRREMEEIMATMIQAGYIVLVEKETNSTNGLKSDWIYPLEENEDEKEGAE